MSLAFVRLELSMSEREKGGGEKRKEEKGERRERERV